MNIISKAMGDANVNVPFKINEDVFLNANIAAYSATTSVTPFKAKNATAIYPGFIIISYPISCDINDFLKLYLKNF